MGDDNRDETTTVYINGRGDTKEVKGRSMMNTVRNTGQEVLIKKFQIEFADRLYTQFICTLADTNIGIEQKSEIASHCTRICIEEIIENNAMKYESEFYEGAIKSIKA